MTVYRIVAREDSADDMPKYLTKKGVPWSFDATKAMTYRTLEHATKCLHMCAVPPGYTVIRVEPFEVA